MPDPLVVDIAERADSAPPVPPPLHEPGASRPDEPAEGDELAELDEQLLIAAAEAGAQWAERGSLDEANAPAGASVLELMRGVHIPTTRALGTASLEPLRAAILRIMHAQDPQRWAAYHVILGGALSARSGRTHGYRRANVLIEATRAFDSAYSIYALLRPHVKEGFLFAHSCDRSDYAGRCSRCRPASVCVGERDGATLIARAATGPTWENSHLLERAVACLRAARAGAAVRSWTWVSSTNNLACALTLLGKRTPTAAGLAMLGEAARVLHEVLRVHAHGLRREDRASTLINLAEALLSMAERETPAMRLKKIERAFTASSAALLTVIPPQLAWLVRLDRPELA